MRRDTQISEDRLFWVFAACEWRDHIAGWLWADAWIKPCSSRKLLVTTRHGYMVSRVIRNLIPYWWLWNNSISMKFCWYTCPEDKHSSEGLDTVLKLAGSPAQELGDLGSSPSLRVTLSKWLKFYVSKLSHLVSGNHNSISHQLLGSLNELIFVNLIKPRT